MHPLAPLTADEIETAIAVLTAEGRVTASTRFALINLNEPPKEEVLGWQVGAPVRREVFAVVLDVQDGRVFEAVVDVIDARLVSWEHIEGVQPPFLLEDFEVVQEVVKSDPGWQEAVRRRGITDLENVWVDVLSPGYFGFADEEGLRLARAPAYYSRDAITPYARPIEGLVAFVDLNNRRVIQLVDAGVVPLPPGTAAPAEGSLSPAAEAAQPTEETGQEGFGIQVNDGEVWWRKWHFRFRVEPRTGPVLYTVGYEQDGRIRSILYRGSLSEMVVPYGDPGPAWFFRNLFDAGEYGLGRWAVELQPDHECPAPALFFATVLADDWGAPYEQPNAVCLFERHGNIVGTHYKSLRQVADTSETAELVLRFVATIGNYDYAFDWVFHHDGTLSAEVTAAGIVQPKAVASSTMSSETAGEDTRFGQLVGENVVAPYHQHFFNWRLDLDIDGRRNSLVEVNVNPLPPQADIENWPTGFLAEETTFRTEMEAQRSVNLETLRHWKFVNPNVRNKLQHPVGYALEPGETTVPYVQPDWWGRRRAGFLDHHVWVTPYNPDELYAAGEYPNQSRSEQGLPIWAQANRPIENEDIVLWYTMGSTHVPRTEDWPVMSPDHFSFKLVPTNFFDRNPNLDS